LRFDSRFTRFVTVVLKRAASYVIATVYLGSPRGAFPFFRHLFRISFLVPCFLLAVSAFPCQVVLSSCPAFMRHSTQLPLRVAVSSRIGCCLRFGFSCPAPNYPCESSAFDWASLPSVAGLLLCLFKWSVPALVCTSAFPSRTASKHALYLHLLQQMYINKLLPCKNLIVLQIHIILTRLMNNCLYCESRVE